MALGTRHLAGCSAVCYLVADQPLLRMQSIERLLDAWQCQPEFIVCSASDGRRGNPCIFPQRFFPELMVLTGDRGGSAVLRRHPACIKLVELPSRELCDCDTPEQLARLVQPDS